MKSDQEDQPETIECFAAWRREVMDPLGEGPVPVREGRTLKTGPLAPFESKVLRWSDQLMPANHDE